MKEEGGGIVFTLCIFQMPCDLLFLILALDYLKKKTEEEEGGRLLGGAVNSR